MIALLVTVLTALLAYSNFLNKKYHLMLFYLTAIANDYFGFGKILGHAAFKTTDILLVIVCVIWITLFLKEKNTFQYDYNKIGKSIWYLFVFITLVFIGTILLHQDTFIYALRVYRPFLVLPFYFVVLKLDEIAINKYLRLLLVFSVIQGIFYYLQFVGINGILSGYGADNEFEGMETRLGNFPIMASIFFLYFLFKKDIPIGQKVLFLAFWGLMPIFGQMRGRTLMLALGICVYLYCNRKVSYLKYVVIAYAAFTFLISPMMERRSQDAEMSTGKEIMYVLKNPFGIYDYYTTYIGKESGGTFLFRIAVLSERVAFMIENPKYIPFGVGCVCEESPNNIYHMTLGTITREEGKDDVVNYLASADNVWVGILMRFGLLGVILLISVHYNIIKESFSKISSSRNTWFTVYACMAIPEFIGTFNGNMFDRTDGLVPFCITAAIITILSRNITPKTTLLNK